MWCALPLSQGEAYDPDNGTHVVMAKVADFVCGVSSPPGPSLHSFMISDLAGSTCNTHNLGSLAAHVLALVPTPSRPFVLGKMADFQEQMTSEVLPSWQQLRAC